MKSLLRNNWIISIVVNLVILIAILICTDMAYETNDDYAIAMRVVDGYPYVTFINVWLMKLLIGLQGMMPGINAFVLFQIFMGFVSFTVITWVLLEKTKEGFSSSQRFWLMLTSVAIICIFAIDQYSVLQFTKASALMLVAGMLLLIHSFIFKHGAGYYVLAFVLIYTGFCLRFMNLFVAIGFAGIYLVAWIIINHRNLKSDGYLGGKMIAAFGISCLLLVGTAGLYQASMNANSGTEELKDYVDFDYYRQFVCDYPIYESYSQNQTAFNEIGIDENDLYLMSNWYLDPDGAASTENLKTINDIYQDGAKAESFSAIVKHFLKGCLCDIRDMNRSGVHLLLLGIVALAGLVAYKPRYCLYVIAIGLFTVVIYLYLYYLGRPAYRAFYIADLAAMIWMLYFADHRYMRKWSGRALCISAVLALICVIPIYDTASGMKTSAENGQMPAEMAKFLDENSDNFYVFGKGQKGSSPYYADPMHVPKAGYQANSLGFGSWGTDSPYLTKKLGDYGLSNTYGDLINNDKAFVFEEKNKDRLEKYMNKWYGEGIYFEQEGEVEGHMLWSVKKD